MTISISGFTFQGGSTILGSESPISSGSLLFGGTRNIRTSTAGSSVFAFGTGDYTIEFWVYPTASTRQDWVNVLNTANNYRTAVYYTGTQIQYLAGTTSAATGKIAYTIAGASLNNAWHHLALSRVSGSSRLFLDGVQIGSTYSDTLNFSDTSMVFYAGRDPGAGTTYMSGNLSNIRVVKGVGVYTGTFAVPNTPLTATQSAGVNISEIATGQTQLLLNTENGASYLTDSSINNFTITNNNSVTANASNPFS